MEKLNTPNWLNEELTTAFEEISDAVEHDFDITGNIEDIPHESYDGFFPFTNGGVQFTAPMRLVDASCSGSFPNNKDVATELERAIEYGNTVARETFISNNREVLSQSFTKKELDENSDNINYHSLYELKYGSLAEELSEMEMDCNVEYFFIEHRVMFFKADNNRNITGKDELYFYSAVNTDYDYGRDSGLMDCFEQTVPVNELRPDIIQDIVKNMLQSV